MATKIQNGWRTRTARQTVDGLRRVKPALCSCFSALAPCWGLGTAVPSAAADSLIALIVALLRTNVAAFESLMVRHWDEYTDGKSAEPARHSGASASMRALSRSLQVQLSATHVGWQPTTP